MSRTTRSPEKCAAELSREVAETTRDVDPKPRRYIGTLIDESGWKKRSPQRLKQLDDALRDEALIPSVDIKDISLPLDTWVRFARSPFDDRKTGARFADEACLNAYLANYHTEAFAGIPGLENLKFVESEQHVVFAGEDRYVDLVFDDDGTTVVVELEKGDPPDGSVVQLHGYLNAKRQHGVKALRGVLVTGVPDNAQHELVIIRALDGLRADFPVEWYTYQVGVSLVRVD